MRIKDRLALLLMGAWLLGTLFMFTVATLNFRTVSVLLDAQAPAEFQAQVQVLGPAAARQLLRYLASELNRVYFGIWNVVQTLLGGGILLLLGGSVPARRARQCVAVMLAFVLVMLLWLTPEIRSLGRSLDFVQRNPEPPALRHFWLLHAIYTTLDLGKLALGVAAALWLIRQSHATAVALDPN